VLSDCEHAVCESQAEDHVSEYVEAVNGVHDFPVYLPPGLFATSDPVTLPSLAGKGMLAGS